MTSKIQLKNAGRCSKKIYSILLILFSLAGLQAQSFITTWQTDNPGTSGPTEITIPTTGGGYNYDVDWNNDGTFDEFGLTGSVTHDFLFPGTRTIRIQGDFPRIFFQSSGDKSKIIRIEQWGDIAWTSMNGAFSGCTNLINFAPDAPDLSGVTDLSNMFNDCIVFDGDLSGWDVSTITNMAFMFSGASAFNGSLAGWNVGEVLTMQSMFQNASAFNQDLSTWGPLKVLDMSRMFSGAQAFNGNIDNWVVTSVTNMGAMFENAIAFNRDIGAWNVSGVTNMGSMFFGATSFNQDLNGWTTTALNSMTFMFSGATSFNSDLTNWNVSGVNSMVGVFSGATNFNGDVSNWNVSGVTLMTNMFSSANAFTGDLSSWVVSNVTNMGAMFRFANSFNSDISGWNVSMVTNMGKMFNFATSFNQDISGWNVSAVLGMESMFRDATSFDQNLGGWDIGSVTEMDFLLDNTALTVDNYDNTLAGWSGLTGVPSGLTLGALNLAYCNAVPQRTNLTTTLGWNIVGDGFDCSALPVELISFKATPLENKEVLMVWKTTNEVNNEGFEIQKSPDSRTWESIGFVESKEQTSNFNEYSFIDDRIDSGKQYYRLKQIDWDGNFEYSNIEVIEVAAEDLTLTIFPNPSSREVNLYLESTSTNKKVQAFLSDQLGRKIWTGETTKLNPVLEYEFQLEPGIYFLTLVKANQITSEKIVINK